MRAKKSEEGIQPLEFPKFYAKRFTNLCQIRYYGAITAPIY